MYDKKSPEMLKFIKALENKQLTVEEIEQNEIIKSANAKASSFNTSLINTPERNKLRAEIKQQLLNIGSADSTGTAFAGEIRKERRAHIVIGLSASGKSTVVSNPLSYEHKSRIIDSDMAKEMLPEYDNGFGASIVHKESKEISNQVLCESIDKGDNIIVPIIGSSANKVQELHKQLKDAGYSVCLHLNEVTTEEAIRRCALRFAYTGRFIPIKVLKDYGNKPSEIYEQLKTQFDGYAKYDNNGKEKILIEHYENATASKASKQGWWESNLDSNKKYPLMRDEVITKKRRDGKAICLFLPVEGAEKGKCADFWVATSQVSIEPKDGKAYVTAITKVGAKDSFYLRKSINIKFAQGKKEASAQSTDDSANVME
jgi:predicted ABC-type ATPase